MGQDIERAAESLKALYRSGALSDDASDALATVEGAAEIGAGLGERSVGDELLLALILVDDSTSIATNITEIRAGHKHMLEALSRIIEIPQMRSREFPTWLSVQ